MTQAAVLDRGQGPHGSFAIDGFHVCGVVSAVPTRVVGNDFFAERFSPEDILETTKMIGVKERRWIAVGQTTADLCEAAARSLMEHLAWVPNTVDAIIFVSQTPDHQLPATACLLQHKLGLAKGAAAFDVGLGCSGYIYGMWIASALIKAGARRVLLLAGDTSSRLIDMNDRSTALLFGDAGTATGLERTDDAGPALFTLGTDGEGANNLRIAKGGRSKADDDESASDRLYMDGSQIFSFTLSSVPALVRTTLARAKLAIEDLDYLLLHQANAFMLQHIGKKLGVVGERLPMNMDRFGNTSSASIPLLLSTNVADAVTSRATTLLLAGFGVGYSWGACALASDRMTCARLLVV